MLDLYVTTSDKTTEVMILDPDVLGTRSHLRRNRKYNCSLIIFVNCDWLFENTAQHLLGVSLKLEYKLYLLN